LKPQPDAVGVTGKKMQHSVVQREFDALGAEYENNRLSEWYKAHSHEIVNHCPHPIRAGYTCNATHFS